jgi:hypothetical protein
MRAIPAILIAAAVLCNASSSGAATRRRAAAPMVLDEISVTFVPVAAGTNVIGAGDGLLDLGRIAHEPRRGNTSRHTTKVQMIGVRIDGRGRSMTGTATLRASLQDVDTRCTIRIDGITLSRTATLIAARAPIGVAVPHRIEIDVPADVPEGMLSASIDWDVTTD